MATLPGPTVDDVKYALSDGGSETLVACYVITVDTAPGNGIH